MKENKQKRYATHLAQADGTKVYVSASNKEDYNKRIIETKCLIGAGVDVADQTTFADYAQMWINAYKKGKLRESSFITLQLNMEKHVVPFFGGMKVKDVRPMHIQFFMTTISEKSHSVQTKCLQIVKAIFRSAVDNGLIPKSPVTSDVKAGGDETEEEEPLTKEQSVRLLQAVSGTRAYLFVLLLLTTGLRRGEALGLMWEDVDWDNQCIHVRHNKAFLGNQNDCPVTEMLKTDAAKRDIPMCGILYNALWEEMEVSTSDFVFSMPNGNSLTRASFRALWKLIDARSVREGKELGDPVGGGTKDKITLDFSTHPHQLRHTYITQLFESGCDLKEVQYLAGHSTPEITLRIYTHYRRTQRQEETKAKIAGAMAYLTA